MPQNVAPSAVPSAVPSVASAPEPTEGAGVGITCTLVQSASAAYNKAISLSGTDDTLVSYYAQALHMACLRSSPGCKIPDCDMVENVRKFVQPACQEDLGNEFEEDIFTDLVQGDSFSDVASRLGKADSVVKDLAQQIDSKQIASPFLNFMLSTGEARDSTQSLAKTYYSTVQVFYDLQPILDKYFQGKIADSDSGNLKSTCSLALTVYEMQCWCGIFCSNCGQQGFKGCHPPSSSCRSCILLCPAQIRNDQLVKALQSAGSLDLDSASIADLASYLEAKLPKSIAYKCQQLHPLQISRFQHRNC